MVFITKSERETESLGKEIGTYLEREGRNPLVVGFIGDLGAGKTTLIQALCKYWGVKENVFSPTFILERIYKVRKKHSVFKNVYHYDLYRIPKEWVDYEVKNLGLKENMSKKGNIVFIEWADKIMDFFRKDSFLIFIDFYDGGRKIRIEKMK